jgi:hypothetical protein
MTEEHGEEPSSFLAPGVVVGELLRETKNNKQSDKSTYDYKVLPGSVRLERNLAFCLLEIQFLMKYTRVCFFWKIIDSVTQLLLL